MHHMWDEGAFRQVIYKQTRYHLIMADLWKQYLFVTPAKLQVI